MEREEIQKRLKKELDKNRYEHTLGVMYIKQPYTFLHARPFFRDCPFQAVLYFFSSAFFSSFFREA